MKHRTGRDDAGQLMLLIIFFALIIAALITAVVDASTYFLAQREMQAVADGAALDAAQQADVAALYQDGAGQALQLTRPQVTDTAMGYATAAAHIPHECSAKTYLVAADVEADGQTVTVVLTCRVPLPFVNEISQFWSDGVTATEVSHARAALTPLG